MQAQQLTSRSFLGIICIPLTQDGSAATPGTVPPPAGTAATPADGAAVTPAARPRAARPKPKPKAKVMKAVMKKSK